MTNTAKATKGTRDDRTMANGNPIGATSCENQGKAKMAHDGLTGSGRKPSLARFAGALIVALGSLAIGAAGPVQAQGAPAPSAPGWAIPTQHQLVSPEQALQEVQAAPQSATTQSAGATAQGSQEIAELARALQHDPELIYEYVHDNIDLDLGFGSLRGAVGTMLDGEGNSFDQSTLMIALLRESGYTANYIYGVIALNTTDLANLFDIEVEREVLTGLLGDAGVPALFSPPSETEPLDGIFMAHAWVKATIDGTDYLFDPSFKTYDRNSAIDLAAAMGYDQADLLAKAMDGAIDGTDYIQNFNRGDLREELNTYAGSLIDEIRSNHEAASLNEIISGRTILPDSGPVLRTSLPKNIPDLEWTEIPDVFRTTLRVEHLGIDQLLYSDEIFGKRLTIFYTNPTGSTQPELRLDGSIIQSGNAVSAGSSNPVTLTIDHPIFDNTFPDQTKSPELKAGGSFLIMNGWGRTGREHLRRHRQRLQENKQAGGDDDSEAVLGEALAVASNAWLAQNSLVARLAGRMARTEAGVHHAVGIVGYADQRPFVDIPLVAASIADLDLAAGNLIPTFYSIGGASSSLESAVLEQFFDVEAASTISLLDLAVSSGQKVFEADSSNYASSVAGQLAAYSTADANSVQNAIDQGSTLFLPERGDLTIGDWTGVGYLGIREDGSTISAQYKISGGSDGGFAGGTVFHNEVRRSAITGMRYTKTRTSFVTPDPVDRFTGYFLLDNEDITVGSGDFPFSLGLQRNYTSANRLDESGLGLGWRHNLDLVAQVDSDGFQGMGEDSPIDAAATIAALYVSLDMLDQQRTLDRILVAALAQNWATDQVTDNVVTIVQPDSTEQFVKLPDGSFNPPPGSASQLSQDSGDSSYLLRTKDGLELDFNPDGKIEEWRNPNGVTVTFTYSGDKLSSVSNGMGRQLSFTYSGERISQVSDGNGRSVGYSYDTDGNLTTFTDAAGDDTTYAYDLPGRLTQMFTASNPTQAFMTNEYDYLDRVKSQLSGRGHLTELFITGTNSVHGTRSVERDPLGNDDVLYFNVRGRMLRQIDRAGFETINLYDGQDRLIKTTQPELNSIEYVYDERHNPTKVTRIAKPGSGLDDLIDSFTYEPNFNKVTSSTDPLGRTTTFTVNSTNGNVEQIIRPQVGGQTPITLFTYNSRGQVETVTDAEGRVSRNTYDPVNGNLLSTIEDDGGLNLTSSFGYDPVGNVTSETDPRGHTTTAEYNAMRQVERVTAPAPLSYVTEFDYDEDDRLTETRRQTGDAGDPWQITSNTYDVAGNVTTTTDPSNNVTSLEYDELDRLKKTIDAELRETETVYDPVGRLDFVIDALGQVERENSYTPNGLPATMKDANGETVAFLYDGFDRPIRTTYPDGSFEEVTYDAAGRAITNKTRDDDTITLGYDDLDRVTSRSFPDIIGGGTTAYSFSYDLTGLLTQASNPDATVVRSYDTAGRLTQETRGLLSVQYDYDASSNRTRITWPDNYFVDYDYDELDRMILVSENGTTPLATYGYDDLSRRSSKHFDVSNFETTYGYAANDNLLSIGHGPQGGSQEVAFTYGYNGVNERSAQSVTNAVYLYSPQQNSTVLYQPNLLNQYAYVDGTAHLYDGNGNLIGDGDKVYSYDAESRLVNVVTATATASYRYGPLERRIEKTVDGAITVFVHAGDEEIAEYDSNGTLVRRFVPGAGFGEIVATVEASGVRFFHHEDGIGSTVARTSDAGLVTEINAFGPFGEGPAPSGINRFGFTGQRFDDESGLYYFRARHYSPTLGRFLQPDPAGFVDGLNLYTYAGNSPISFVDPLGLSRLRTSGKTNNLFRRAASSIGSFIDRNRDTIATTVGIAAGVGIDFALGGPTGEAAFLSPLIAASVRSGLGRLSRSLSPLSRGRISEARVLRDLGLQKNRTAVSTSEGRSIPDALTRRQSIEIKDSVCVACTRQVRIQTEAARQSGRESVLITGPRTHVTRPAARAFDRIIRRPDLGPR